MRHSWVSHAAVIVLAVINGDIYAEILDSENFESFSNLPFEIVEHDDWMVLDGQEANVTVVDISLGYNRGSIVVDGGSQALQLGPDLPSATTNNLVDWVFSEVESDNVWFSYLIQTSEGASSAIAGESDPRNFFQTFISTDGSSNAQSLSMVLDNNRGGPPDGDHNFRARAGSSNQNVNGFTDSTGTELNLTTQTHFIVGHLQKVADEYETVSIYANPGTDIPPETPTASSTWEPVDLTSLAQFTVRISGLQSDDVYLIDELVIGESYQDVVPVDTEFVLGDFDSNGSLDFGDFLILANNLFEGTTYEQGDFNFSGQVDLADFISFREAYSSANPAGAASVPEPSGLLVFGLSFMGLLSRRRR